MKVCRIAQLKIQRFKHQDVSLQINLYHFHLLLGRMKQALLSVGMATISMVNAAKISISLELTSGLVIDQVALLWNFQ